MVEYTFKKLYLKKTKNIFESFSSITYFLEKINLLKPEDELIRFPQHNSDKNRNHSGCSEELKNLHIYNPD